MLGAIAPRPRINMEHQSRTIAFTIAPGIPDAFVVPKEDVYTTDMHVSQWQQSLTAAFETGVLPHFQKPAGAADVTLELRRTEIYFDDKESASVVVSTTKGAGSGTSIKIACNIQYQAYLLDAERNVLAKDIQAVRYGDGSWNREKMVEGAVEAMFEQIADSLLRQAPRPKRN